MLLGAYSVLLKCPGRLLGGGTVSPEPAQWGTAGAARGRFYGDSGGGFDRTSATPIGYQPGSGAWIPAQKSGAIASINQLVGTGAVAGANLAGGRNAESALAGLGSVDAAATALAALAASCAGSSSIGADISATAEATAAILGAGLLAADIIAAAAASADLTGSGSVSDAAMGLVVSLVADLAGSGAISDAAMGLLAGLAADLTGSSSLGADITGAYAIAADLAGTGSCTAALGALAGLLADLAGSGTLAAGATAIGGVSADITLAEVLSPSALAAAVWNAAVASFQAAGSMGEAMATAGSGGLSPTQATALLELYRLAGLDPTRPLVVTATTRVAGDISQTITEAAGTVTVERQ